MPKLFRSLFLATALTLVCSTVIAQQEKEILTQSVSAVLLEDRPLNEPLYYKNQYDEYKEFRVGILGRGPQNIQVLSDKLVLNSKSLDENGNDVYTPVFSIEIPRVDQVLVLFFFDLKKSFKFRVYNNTAQARPANSGFLINLTGDKVAGGIDKERFTLAPWGTFQVNGLTSGDQKRFKFGYSVEFEGKFDPDPSIISCRIPNNNLRWLGVFTYYDNIAVRETANGTENTITRLPNFVQILDNAPEPEDTEKG